MINVSDFLPFKTSQDPQKLEVVCGSVGLWESPCEGSFDNWYPFVKRERKKWLWSRGGIWIWLKAMNEHPECYHRFPNQDAIVLFGQHSDSLRWICMLSHSVASNSATPWTVAHQTPRPWHFPGKNTGVGCHSFSTGPFRPRDGTWVSCISCIGRQILYHCAI